MFTLLNLETAEHIDRAQFASGARAARAARLLSRKTGRRFQPRPVAAPVDWQSREAARFESGEYVALAPQLAALAPPEHYAHCAKKAPDLIAYTKDAAKGAADRQSLISIAAYVDLVAPDWTELNRAALVDLQKAHALAFATELKLATTEDEIERVYTLFDRDAGGVAHSCMRFEARRFASRVDGRPYHPTRVYAAGDLAIAYLANARGETTARALVWPAKKLHSRIYCGNDSTLARLLKAQGYKGAGYYGGADMSGARLLRVESDSGDLVCPYLDEVQTVEDCGDFLRIGGDLDATSTSGEIETAPRTYCERCEERVDEDDVVTVCLDSRRRQEAQWCSHCASSYGFYCQGREDYFSDDVECGEMNGETYSLAWLERNATRCERYDEWCDETDSVVVDEYGNTESWGRRAIDHDAYKCAGAYYSADIESVRVITAVDAPRAIRWRALTYLRTVTVDVPRFLIDESIEDGAPIAFLAKDGLWYATDYVDHHPLNRPRRVPAEKDRKSVV